VRTSALAFLGLVGAFHGIVKPAGRPAATGEYKRAVGRFGLDVPAQTPWRAASPKRATGVPEFPALCCKAARTARSPLGAADIFAAPGARRPPLQQSSKPLGRGSLQAVRTT
jgi:hypothetical protein